MHVENNQQTSTTLLLLLLLPSVPDTDCLNQLPSICMTIECRMNAESATVSEVLQIQHRAVQVGAKAEEFE